MDVENRGRLIAASMPPGVEHALGYYEEGASPASDRRLDASGR
jgi:hypothetical protein